MEIDKRVDSLEGEFKLMRGELKQTLTSVRDYLLNLKLPPSQEATLLAAAMSGGSHDMTMDGKFSVERDDGKRGSDRDEELLGSPRNAHDEPEANDEAEAESDELEAELPEEAEGSEETQEPGQPEPGPQEDTEDTMEDGIAETVRTAGARGGTALAQGVPPVNLLANLIRWVAVAKKEIGSEQLATFLEVYGISGHLSPESKDIILHLAEVTSAETADAGTAEVWSKLILELHGILAGGEAPLQPLTPVRLPRKEERLKPKSSKLKLVLSDNDGKDHEFSLNIKGED